MAEVKIILLGESGVGKTCFLHRFKTGEFLETLPPTVHVEHHSKIIRVDGQEVKMILWDTAGQERFKNSLAASYFRNAEGVLLLYDVTDIESFFALSSWVDYMKKFNEEAPILVVGNKNEEDPRRKTVNLSVVHSFVREHNLDNIEISVKTGENVEQAFTCLVKKVFMARKAATAKKAAAAGFSYLTEKKNEDVIKLKDASMQTQPSTSWCCFF